MQSLPPCWPYIRFLFVVVKELLHHFLHPSLAAFDLWFTTLGGKYLWSDFHRLAVCHARHTMKKTTEQVCRFFSDCYSISRNWINYSKILLLNTTKKYLQNKLFQNSLKFFEFQTTFFKRNTYILFVNYSVKFISSGNNHILIFSAKIQLINN